MATYDATGGAKAVVPAIGVPASFRLMNVIDLSKYPCVQNDVLKILPVKAGMLIRNVAICLLVAEGAACAANTVGDTGDADGFGALVDLNAAVNTVAKGVGGVDAYVTAGGRLYTADGFINLTVAAALGADAAKFVVSAVGDMYFETFPPSILNSDPLMVHMP